MLLQEFYIVTVTYFLKVKYFRCKYIENGELKMR